MGAIKVTVAAVGAVLAMLVVMVSAEIGDPTLPDIWKVVEDSYEARLTVNFPDLDPGVTMLVEELYDIKEERGGLEVVVKGAANYHKYYTKSQQAFFVSDHTCDVGMVNEVDNYRLWGWIYDDSHSSAGKQNFIYGPSAILRIPKDFEKEITFLGETTVRNISAYHWFMEHPKGYVIDYYFAADEWLMPYGHVMDGINLKAPLLVTVFGPQVDPWNQGQPEWDQTIYYEYTDFTPRLAPEHKKWLLMQEGLDCKGRVTMDPDYLEPPNPPAQFQVFLETVVRWDSEGFSDKTFVFRSWLYYSNWMQLLRLDVNPGQDAQDPVAAYKSIHDYNTGIEYRIDMVSGECQMRPLDSHQLGNQVGSGGIGGVIMADPNQLFHLDDKYIFNGFSETRGIKTTRWTAVRDDIYNPETKENYKKVVVDYHFNSKEMQLEGEQEGQTLPLRVDVTVYNDSDITRVYYRDTLNLLHMQTSFQEYDFNPFHVGECMALPTERTWLKITFAGDWLHGASQKPDGFKKMLIQYVADKTKSSYIRFPEVQLDHDLSDLVYATMLVLEPAPYHLQFHQLDDRKPTDYDTRVLFAMHDVDACAYSCLNYKKFACRSFYKCKGDGRTCYVSNFKNSGGKPLNVKPCAHYNKALVTNNNAVQKQNAEVELILAEKILTGDFTIELEYTDHEGTTQKGKYHALFEQNELNGDDPAFEDLIRADFYMVYRRGKLINKYTDLKLTKVSYATCLTKCLGQLSFECETFSYCYNSEECMLSSQVEDAPPPDNHLVQQSDCVVVVRAHTNDYIPLEGLVYLGDPKEVHTTLGVERCAYHCDNATDFTCRSFDFCLDSLKCNLYDHHTANAPDTMFNTSKDCMHFSRNAMVDFTKHPKQQISGTRNRYIKDTIPSVCAQECEDEPDFGCNGFDYCNDPVTGITCFLTENHYSDDGTTISDSLTCDHYSRDYYEGQDRDSYSHNRKSNYIYGPGDMAGLAVSMLVISIGLTFAGVYIYNKHKQ